MSIKYLPIIIIMMVHSLARHHITIIVLTYHLLIYLFVRPERYTGAPLDFGKWRISPPLCQTTGLHFWFVRSPSPCMAYQRFWPYSPLVLGAGVERQSDKQTKPFKILMAENFLHVLIFLLMSPLILHLMTGWGRVASTLPSEVFL